MPEDQDGFRWILRSRFTPTLKGSHSNIQCKQDDIDACPCSGVLPVSQDGYVWKTWLSPNPGEPATWTQHRLVTRAANPKELLAQDAEEKISEVEQASALDCANRAMKRVPGFLFSDHPTARFNGLYRPIALDDIDISDFYKRKYAGWPILQNEEGMYCYRQLKRKEWLLRTRFTPGETGSHSQISAPLGPLPMGENIAGWRSWIEGEWKPHSLTIVVASLEQITKDDYERNSALLRCQAQIAQVWHANVLFWLEVFHSCFLGLIGALAVHFVDQRCAHHGAPY
eukprot:SAG31_NODE_5561_length_2457_cov_1.765903_2_plen_284_part_00